MAYAWLLQNASPIITSRSSDRMQALRIKKLSRFHVLSQNQQFNVVGLIGAFHARFAPQGMARAAFAMAIAQILVPVIVLLIPTLRGALLEPPGLMGVIGLNAFFAALFVGSALLFRQAAQAQPTHADRVDAYSVKVFALARESD